MTSIGIELPTFDFEPVILIMPSHAPNIDCVIITSSNAHNTSEYHNQET